MAQGSFLLFIAIPCLISIILTYLLGRFFKKPAIVKYIPAIVSLLIAIGFYIKARYYSSGFEDLAYIILGFIAAIVFIVSLVTAVIMDIVTRTKNKSKV